LELDEFRRGLDRWLDERGDALSAVSASTLDEHVEHTSAVKRAVFEAGWGRWGWPERVGGLGGSTLLRAYLGEALTLRNLVDPGVYSMAEVLLPTMITYAGTRLAADMVPRHLSGAETWCQGFSEPDTGSNLAALACRAVVTDTGWRVNGQKVWTSLAQFAARCTLLVRTGEPESRHRGITALFVDMDSPGITVRPIETMHGRPEFCEVFFEDVDVPADRTLGDPGQGWAIAMDLLPFERSSSLWHRGALLHRRFDALLAEGEAMTPAEVGETFTNLYAFRARSLATQHRVARAGAIGAETSVDKVLIAAAEQSLFDLAGEAIADRVLFGGDPASTAWRADVIYSRAASIYGGSSEIQRNIIAKRLLDLGDDR